MIIIFPEKGEIKMNDQISFSGKLDAFDRFRPQGFRFEEEEKITN